MASSDPNIPSTSDERSFDGISHGYAPDGRPVNLLFVLLVPEQANETHLQLLSELAQMFSDRTFREELLHAPDAAHIHQMFMNWGSDATNQRRAAV